MEKKVYKMPEMAIVNIGAMQLLNGSPTVNPGADPVNPGNANAPYLFDFDDDDEE